MTHHDLPPVEIPPRQPGADGASLPAFVHAGIPVVSVGDLFHGHGLTWHRALGSDAPQELEPPRPAPQALGGLLGGVRMRFASNIRFTAGTQAVSVATPTSALTRGLDDDWHNVVAHILNVLTGEAGLTAHNEPGSGAGDPWHIHFATERTLPGRSQRELVEVSICVDPGGSRPTIESMSLAAEGTVLELPFDETTFVSPGGSEQVRIPQSLPERELLNTYMPLVPSRTMTRLPDAAGGVRQRQFVSEVGLNQVVLLSLVPDLTDTLMVTDAELVQRPATAAPTQPSHGAAPPAPTLYKVARNVEQAWDVAHGTSAVAVQLAVAGHGTMLSQLVRDAHAAYTRGGIVPTHESAGTQAAGDVWTFALSAGELSYALKLRVIDLGAGVADVVDARLLARAAQPVQWGRWTVPNEGLT